MKYIFDVDGTLTPSRKKIDKEFQEWFSDFCDESDVYIVSGSDRAKTIEQIGEEIYYKLKRAYQCSGNDVWEGDANIRTKHITLPEDCEDFLNNILEESAFPHKTGTHIEKRAGLVNFSIVGRQCDEKQRREYMSWDKKTHERLKIKDFLNKKFPNIVVSIAGDTGVDITLPNFGKDQILSDFENFDVSFFGDKTEEGGNDHDIYEATLYHTDYSMSYSVTGWRETWEVLKFLKVQR